MCEGYLLRNTLGGCHYLRQGGGGANQYILFKNLFTVVSHSLSNYTPRSIIIWWQTALIGSFTTHVTASILWQQASLKIASTHSVECWRTNALHTTTSRSFDSQMSVAVTTLFTQTEVECTCSVVQCTLQVQFEQCSWSVHCPCSMPYFCTLQGVHCTYTSVYVV